VHAFKALLLKNTGIMAIAVDLTFLALFTLVMVVAETALFKRSL
jgi:hypothetical protein